MESNIWHYDYVRLAWDAGFCFDNKRAKNSLDWSSIGLIDIEKVITDRDIATVEKYIPIALDFRLNEDLSRILEPNFVKIFKLCQLSIQYLIFCKKYLDKTVSLLKTELAKGREAITLLETKDEENKMELTQLKKKVKDLKSSLDSCPIYTEASFKCPECSKMFATEEYLNAHIKRRHESFTLLQNETDKLQMEIKQLKEQLNSTEKYTNLVKSEEKISAPKEIKSNDSSSNEHSIRVRELQEKFDKLKDHVEQELKTVNDQKFYLEKYEKWMEMAFQKFGSLSREVVSKEDKTSKQDHPENTVKTDNQTQTYLDQENSGDQHQQSNSISKNNEIKKSIEIELNEIIKLQQQIKEDTNNQMGHFEEVVQNKLTESLQKLENQMTIFWHKLYEVQNSEPVLSKKIVGNVKVDSDYDDDTKESSAMEIKPGSLIPAPKDLGVNKSPPQESISTQYIVPNKTSSTKKKQFQSVHKEPIEQLSDINKEEVIKSKRNKKPKVTSAVSKPVLTQKEIVTNTVNPKTVSSPNIHRSVSLARTPTDSEDSDSTFSESSKSISILQAKSKPSNTSTLAKHSITSLKQAVQDQDVRDGLQNELKMLMHQRLQEVGVSPNWIGLPNRSFQKAFKIIKHQGIIASKSFNGYHHIRDAIVEEVESTVSVKNKQSEKSSTKIKSRHKEKSIKSKKIKSRTTFEVMSSPRESERMKVSQSFTPEPKALSKKTILDNTCHKPASPVVNVIREPRKMYASTDDDSDVGVNSGEKSSKNYTPKHLPTDDDSLIRRQKSVLKELKSTLLLQQQPQNLEERENVQLVQSKSVLKSGLNSAVSKKKVLFDLESLSSTEKPAHPIIEMNFSDNDIKESENIYKKPQQAQPMIKKKATVVVKTGENDSTSIGSSVLEMDAARHKGKPMESGDVDNRKLKTKDDSDWDISDILSNKS